MTPKQKQFINLYLDPKSTNFGNAYQSAIKSGFEASYAASITSQKPSWLTEAIKQNMPSEELIIASIQDIAFSHSERTLDRLRALDLLAKLSNLYARSTLSDSNNSPKQIPILLGASTGKIKREYLDELGLEIV